MSENIKKDRKLGLRNITSKKLYLDDDKVMEQRIIKNLITGSVEKEYYSRRWNPYKMKKVSKKEYKKGCRHWKEVFQMGLKRKENERIQQNKKRLLLTM